MSISYIVYADGGARGNPGPAGIGVIIEQESGNKREMLVEISEYIGETTNNQAEYRAVIRALKEIEQRGGQGSIIECILDSELVVKQVSGHFRVKHPELRPLFAQVSNLVSALGGKVHFRAVPRSENRRADQLVNRAIDLALSRRP